MTFRVQSLHTAIATNSMYFSGIAYVRLQEESEQSNALAGIALQEFHQLSHVIQGMPLTGEEI